MELFINTALKTMQLGFYDGENLNIVEHVGNNDHAMIINKLLKENIKVKDIKKIYLINGPGAYTGIRVGVTVAKVIAKENNIKIVDISTLDAMYQMVNKPVVIDARGGRYYSYDGKEEKLILEIEGYILEPKIDVGKIFNIYKNYEGKTYKEITVNYIKPAI